MLDIAITIAIAVAAIALGIFAHRKTGTVRKDERPHQVPWGLVMIGCVFVLFLVAVHAINLIGVDTGPGKGLMGRF